MSLLKMIIIKKIYVNSATDLEGKKIPFFCCCSDQMKNMFHHGKQV